MARQKKDFGYGECQYRFCDLPEKKFKKTKQKHEYCCTDHRIKEWNLRNPRLSEDAKKQTHLDLGLPVQVLSGAAIIEARKKVKGPIGQSVPPLLLPHERIDYQHAMTEKKNSGKRWHYPNWQTSERLQKTLELLRKCNPTNWELMQYTGTTRPKDDCIELRAQGFDIKPIPAGKSEDGKRRISRWVLTENKQ